MDFAALGVRTWVVAVIVAIAGVVGAGSARAYGLVGMTSTSTLTVKASGVTGTFTSYSAAKEAFKATKCPAAGWSFCSMTNERLVSSADPNPSYHTETWDWTYSFGDGTSPPFVYQGVATNLSGTLAVVTACPTGSDIASPAASPPCLCSVGFKASGATCAAVDCAAVVAGLQGQSLSYAGNGASACYQGCTVQAALRGYLSATNQSTTEGPITGGAACVGAPSDGTTPSTSAPRVPAPAGKCWGTVNGADTLVSCSSTAQPQATSTPNSDGTTTTVSRDTICTGASCTTTTTSTVTNNSTGAVVGTPTVSQETKDQQSFCQLNPALSICKTSAFGGACAATTCEGDAVQCAIAREQAARNCQLFDTTTKLSDLGTASANGVAQPAGHPGATPNIVPVQLSSLISSVPLFGSSGGCPSDVMVGGRWLLPFSRMCSQLAMIGVALKGLSLLVAAFITFRKGV